MLTLMNDNFQSAKKRKKKKKSERNNLVLLGKHKSIDISYFTNESILIFQGEHEVFSDLGFQGLSFV